MAKDYHDTPYRWPEGAIVYHIYPRSLQDSNADGIGDLPGIIERLDYLVDLGINALWLSPFYPSPMADFGYDVSDYCDVHPMFGTLDDFKRLLTEAHRRRLKLIIDLVPNHTSDEHQWFVESKKSQNNEYAEWYVWRDGHVDAHGVRRPPNNWLDALTGNSAWEWVEDRQQYYLHSFDKKQPDLNWSNPDVREAVKNAMRFWLDMGVDGFRVDAVYWMAKEPLLSNDPPNPEYVAGEDLKYEALIHSNSRGWPAVYAYLSEMSDVLKESAYRRTQRFMVTEAYPERHNVLADYMTFYVGMDPEVAAPFNFEGVSLAWQAGEWRRFLRSFHTALRQFSPHCVASYAFGNHDQPRLASRLGEAAARSAAIMLFTLPGLVFVYYGEELGMTNVDIPPEAAQDPAAKGDPKNGIGRDPERTPMQWSPAPGAGFTTAAKPWLPLAPDYKTRNVETQLKDPQSHLNLYRRLASMRNKSPTLRQGALDILEVGHPDVLAYSRGSVLTNENYAVLINFSSEPASCFVSLPLDKLLASSDPQTTLAEKAEPIVLAPYEGAVFSVRSL